MMGVLLVPFGESRQREAGAPRNSKWHRHSKRTQQLVSPIARTSDLPAPSPHRLPDQLRPNLRLVFVGTAASTRSAELGHYYAHPGNRFWHAIHEAGITP